MPLHVGDYQRDTTHLRAIGHGAYLSLIMHYWATGSLPEDDYSLATIAHLTDQEWRQHKPILQAFFHDGWKHKRIDAEIAAARASYERRAKAGSKGGKATRSMEQCLSNAEASEQAMLKQPTTYKEVRAAEAALTSFTSPEKELFEKGKQVLGRESGGLIRKLLKAKAGNVALARAAIEQASTKQNPREYIGRIVRGASEETKRIGVQV
jgi:uncharacterized protein YdaU (DUF1376 family)